jgi:NAD(P)-dependent dehydrogenase (short-subunit alcohol dehydrogenase family)
MAENDQKEYEKQQQERPEQHQERQPGREDEMIPPPVYIREDYRGSGKLRNRVALITGGDSGIGRSVAVHFAREGADVAIVYLEEHADAKKTRDLVEKESRRCLLLAGDVGREAFCREAVNATAEYFGRLDLLVNNAGEQHVRSEFSKVSSEQMEKTFRTNFFAYFYMAQAVLDHMGEGAAIINTTSITAYRGSDHLVDYSATKGAIVAFTRSLAKALAPSGIRVNGVAPGPIWAPLIPASFPAEAVKDFGKSTLMGRAGQPSEVGPCYVFLASEDASYMTGQVLHPNGGDFIST